jgi:hypothetical protein
MMSQNAAALQKEFEERKFQRKIHRAGFLTYEHKEKPVDRLLQTGVSSPA